MKWCKSMVIFVDSKSQKPLKVDDWKIHFFLGPAMLVLGSVFRLDALGRGQKTALVGNSSDLEKYGEFTSKGRVLREYFAFCTDFCTFFF